MEQKSFSIIAIIMMAVISIGALPSAISALTNVERYHVGIYSAANVANDKFGAAPGASISIDPPVKKATLEALSSPEFQKHSEAYKNGYIREVDAMYGLKLPYVSYASDDDGNAVITPHYMGVTVSNH
jgi:hypothetical protein